MYTIHYSRPTPSTVSLVFIPRVLAATTRTLKVKSLKRFVPIIRAGSNSIQPIQCDEQYYPSCRHNNMLRT